MSRINTINNIILTMIQNSVSTSHTFLDQFLRRTTYRSFHMCTGNRSCRRDRCKSRR